MKVGCCSGRGLRAIAGFPILLVAREQSKRVDGRTWNSATRKSLFYWVRSVRRGDARSGLGEYGQGEVGLERVYG